MAQHALLMLIDQIGMKWTCECAFRADPHLYAVTATSAAGASQTPPTTSLIGSITNVPAPRGWEAVWEIKQKSCGAIAQQAWWQPASSCRENRAVASDKNVVSTSGATVKLLCCGQEPKLLALHNLDSTVSSSCNNYTCSQQYSVIRMMGS